MKKPVDFQRRRPKQARAHATVNSILEAAVQVLERSGGLNTNSIAERAGVSIGTLYQYFPDKEAILIALARRELGKPTPVLASQQRSLLEALVRVIETLIGKTATARAAGSGRQLRSSVKNVSDGGLKMVGQHLMHWLAPTAPLVRPVFARTRR